MSDVKPGRVYGSPGEPGARSGAGVRLFTHAGEKIAKVCRVEFDAAADEGMATVTALVLTQQGGPVIDPETSTAATATFRAWVRAAAKGEPDPPFTPDAILWNSESGIVRLERDPLPDEALEEINRAGRERAGATT